MCGRGLCGAMPPNLCFVPFVTFVRMTTGWVAGDGCENVEGVEDGASGKSGAARSSSCISEPNLCFVPFVRMTTGWCGDRDLGLY